MNSYFTSGRWLWTWAVFTALELGVGGVFYALRLPESVGMFGIALILAGTLWFDWRSRKRWRLERARARAQDVGPSLASPSVPRRPH